MVPTTIAPTLMISYLSLVCVREPPPLPVPVPVWLVEENAPRSPRPFPGRETAPPLHTMAPAFMAELQSMLSWFPMVVVVDGGSKEAVHVVVWGGTANECLRSLSKRTKKLEPNPLQLYPETLTFRTLDHRMVAARVPTSGAKRQDQRGEEEACLMMMNGLEQRTQKGRRQKSTPTTTKPATDTDTGRIE